MTELVARRDSDATPKTGQFGRGSSSITSTELLFVASITIAGGVLRTWQPAHMAVEHFDEGVYASNLYCAVNGNAYPFRHLYAPPLLPALLEWALIFSGGAASSVMWINLGAGCALVPSVWWVGRAWFGPPAGLMAAGFAAMSPIHILYSRAVLTDGLLCLWMLWGVYWAWRAIMEGRPVAILLAGVCASLAWWTKYNGWLTLAISGAGTAASVIVPRILSLQADWPFVRLAAHFKCAAIPPRGGETTDAADLCRSDGGVERGPSPAAAVVRWGIVSVIAFVGWVPVIVALQEVGGYGEVTANHAKYFVGFAGWADSFTRQAANLAHFHQGLSVVAIVLLVISASLLGPLLSSSPESRDMAEEADRRALAGWMLASWCMGLFVAVPLYSPYPRLVLPWVVAGWMVAGCGIGCLLARSLSLLNAVGTVSMLRRGIAFALLAGAALAQGVANERIGITADHRGLQAIAGQVLERIDEEIGSSRDGETVVVMVLGEPGLFFHLAATTQRRGGPSKEAVILPSGDYGSVSMPTHGNVQLFLAAGSHAPPLEDQPRSVRQHLVPLGAWPYTPSDLVLLDEFGPAALEDRASLPLEPVRLFRVTH